VFIIIGCCHRSHISEIGEMKESSNMMLKRNDNTRESLTHDLQVDNREKIIKMSFLYETTLIALFRAKNKSIDRY
jgi:hypothetical protein